MNEVHDPNRTVNVPSTLAGSLDPGAEQRQRRKVPLALVAALVALLLSGGAFAFWRNDPAQGGQERDGRNAKAVAALLDQAEEALKAGDASRAQVALDAAKKRSAEGGAEKEAKRLTRLDADLALLRDLDAIEQFRWTVVDGRFPDAAAVARRTREALRRFGIDPEAAMDKAAAPVSASAVRQRIVSALDRLLRQDKTAGVRTLLRRVDADAYRDAVRDAVLANDRVKLVELAGKNQALEQLPGFVVFLGEMEVIPVERRRQLLQAAVRRRPGNLGLLMTLGHSYPINQQESADARLRWFQAAVAVAPANVAAYFNLGNALRDKGQVDEAIACYRRTIALDPKFAHAHTNLGAALRDKGQLEEAIACYRQAIALDPKHALAHFNLGTALRDKGQLDAAIACYRQAIALDPKFAQAYTNLGPALYGKGQVDEAIACYQKAIALDPKHALAHYNLGNMLQAKGQVAEAIACYRKALALAPKLAEAHCNLGHALSRQGRFAESLAALKRGHELGAQRPDWRYPSGAWVRQAEAKAALEAKLPAFLKGELQPGDNAERLGLAAVCQAKKLPRTAAGLYAAVFVADPKTANDLKAGHRYNAACSAALAAAGQSEDAARLDDKEQTRLRWQALTWLRADLVLRTRQLETGNPADRATLQRALRHWQKDTDLASIRDKAALAKLPAQEQQAFGQLWAEVAALLTKVGTPTPKEGQ
jgi:tetratricopeptide (TPR) repeat protein